MIKKVLSMAMVLLMSVCASAQIPQVPQLPLDPAVKTGKLENGLTYYILHNEHPKDRANFYIAQKVGSTLEEPTQLGLAHFLEHMAFNGTTNYPGKNMLNYLQSKGIRFGADINAYTFYDETVYNIDNVNTTDKALMDSVLLAVRDWSCGILLEDAEIDAERGVIEEEWRSRNDANFRLLESVLPKIYKEYQYQQSVIGKMDIIRNFPYSEIRNYYAKWYRPDQQGIVIVGDFDADEMEKKVIALFSTIPMPENAAERKYPNVSDNEKPIFAYFDDPEMQYPRVDFSIKIDKMPVELTNTALYVQQDLVQDLLATMINNRLSEYAQKPECKYAYAFVGFGDFWVSKTKAAFDVTVIGKNDITPAFEEAMGIVVQACKTGFTDSELERAKSMILSGYEKRYNERNNTKNEALGKMLYRHFIDNTPHPGAEAELEMVNQIFPMIQVQVLNQIATQILTPENQVVVVSQPRKEGMETIVEDTFMGNLQNIFNKEYEAYVDEVITDPLISELPAPGKILSEQPGVFGTTEMMLSNGMKVIIKSTDFKADEVNLVAMANGGLQSFTAEEAPEVVFASDIYEACRLGNFNPTILEKYLAGKHASLGFDISSTTNYLDGQSNIKDMKYLFEMLYASFTELSADDEAYAARKNRMEATLKAREANPAFTFSQHVRAAQHNGNPLFDLASTALLNKLDYNKGVDLIKNTLKNGAEFTLILTGNINLDSIRPLLEQYVATIPSNPRNKMMPVKVTDVAMATGEIKDFWKEEMQAPATFIYNILSGEMPFNVENSTKMNMVGQLLRIVYTETLREEEGGTYSPSASAALSPVTSQWMVITSFQTNAEQQATMIKRANDEMNKMLADGVTAEAFNKVKGATLSQYENSIRTNEYWESMLRNYLLGYDYITNGRSAIENVTLEDINAFMKKLHGSKNDISVIMEGVPAK